MVTVSLADLLTDSPAKGFSLTCSDPSLPCDSSNLVVKAAEAVAAEARRALETAAVHLHLEKHVPSGGGLGGGSSDAVAALRLLNGLWGLHWDRAKLAGLAARLGSDTAFFLWGGWRLCHGRGEMVEALPLPSAPPPLRLLLVIPEMHVSTAAVYRKLSAPAWKGGGLRTPAEAAAQLQRQLAAARAGLAVPGWPDNALLAAARRVEPRLSGLGRALERSFPGRWQMSGSGSVHFLVPAPGLTPAAAEEALRLDSGLPLRVLEVETCETAAAPSSSTLPPSADQEGPR
jgi:4-diphosphocytidyl-2-C-methyl-D-erythritol kinase